MDNQLVVFDLANEQYGVHIASVESIIKLQPITAVPRTSSFIEGVTNLRGAVLPVMDMRKRFGLEVNEATKDTRIVVVEMNGETIGMVVDAVTKVLSVPEENIEPPPPLVTTADGHRGDRLAFITGIAKVDGHGPESTQGRLIILLDLGQVLNLKEQTEFQTLRQVLPSVPTRQDEALGQTRDKALRQTQDKALRQTRDKALRQTRDKVLSVAV